MPDQPSVPFVSVIVPVFNDEARLGLCLAALEGQSYPEDRYEVIVVDNGSEPPVTPAMKRFGHALVLQEPRPGNSRARLMGIAKARGEVVAFTDSDCVPDTRWLECGVARLQSVAACGLVGGRIDVVLASPERATVAERLSAAMHLKQERFLERGRWAAFANAFTTRDVIERVGAMDGSLVSSSEVEWGHRIDAAGLALAYAPDAVVRHPARSSIRALCRRTVRFEIAWTQLRETKGIGRGWRHFIGQYIVLPLRATYRDVVRSREMTWVQKAQVSALSGGVAAFRLAVYVLVRAGWRVDLRRSWG